MPAKASGIGCHSLRRSLRVKNTWEYFSEVYADYPDVLTTTDLSAMTGLHKKSFQRIIEAGHLKLLASRPRYIIPKVYFLEFLAGRRFIDAWSNSEDFIRGVEGFRAWKKSRSNK